MIDDIAVLVGALRLGGVVHLRLHPAGTDGVDPYPPPTPLRGERAGKTDQAVLARVVCGPIGNAHQARDGGDVDHRATAHRAHRPAALPAADTASADVPADDVAAV